MAAARYSSSNRVRNVFIAGIVAGLVLSWIIGAIIPNGSSSEKDLQKINDRLSAIEQKLATPTPAPQVDSAAQPSTTVSGINKSPAQFIDKNVEVVGKITNPVQGVGFFLQDQDGTYIWVRWKESVPSSSASVRGKIVEFKDQLATWKTEQNWPDNDSSLTAKLKGEKVYLEADSVK
jgi:hypothetical protein